MGTGDTECPTAVKTAKRVAYLIRQRCEIEVDSDFSLVVAEDTEDEDAGANDEDNGNSEVDDSVTGNESDENHSQNLLEPDNVEKSTEGAAIGTTNVGPTDDAEGTNVTPEIKGMYCICCGSYL